MVLQSIGYSRALAKSSRVKVASWRRQHPAIFAHGSLFWSKNRSVLATPSRNLHSRRLCECSTIPNTLQNHAESPALDEYVLKMPLDIQIGSLGAEKFNFKIHKNTHWKKYFLFPVCCLRRKLDFGSAELVAILLGLL